jgi:pSer/pThr/pTyr-binding forkhead associated (FHA) protein
MWLPSRDRIRKMWGRKPLVADSFTIRIQYIDRPPEVRSISGASSMIGREVGDIVLRDPQTSGRHAELLFDGFEVCVRDCGSTNGTWFNGRRISEFSLQPGQWFQMGQTTILLIGIEVIPERTSLDALGSF